MCYLTWVNNVNDFNLPLNMININNLMKNHIEKGNN